MNLIFRLLRIIVAAFFKPRIGIFDSSALSFQVLPTDLDINLHMTNARHLSLMDLGRTDLLIRVGMFGLVKQERWLPAVGSIDIHFHKALQPFQRFRLITRLVCWDEKWLYIEQWIESDQGIHSVAMLRGVFRDHTGLVPTRVLQERYGYSGQSPPFPTQVLCLQAFEEAKKRGRSNTIEIAKRAM